MSSEWLACTIGDVCIKVYSGGTPTSTNAAYYGGHIPWLRTKEVNYGKIVATEMHITELGLKNSSAKLVPINSVIVAMYGNGDTAGRVAINKVPLTTNQACCNLVVDPAKVDYRFLYYYLKCKYQELVDLKNGGAQQNLNGQLIKAFPLVAPILNEQTAIAEIFEGLDDRITLLRETNATLEAIAQTLFKSWFVDFDPVRAKLDGRRPEGMDEATAALFPVTFDESEIGMVPKGWRVTTLGSICKESGGAIQTGPFGSQLHASDYLDIGVPVVMPQDLAGRRVRVEKIARVGDDDVRRLSRHWLRTGDIVFSRRGDVGRHALIGVRESGWLCGTGCLLVRPGQTWPSASYISLALDRADTKAWLLRHAVGATMPNLNTGILNAVPIMRPDDMILEAFDDVARELDERISHGHANMRTLEKLRDTLLPRLISGQLRLPVAKTILEEAIA